MSVKFDKLKKPQYAQFLQQSTIVLRMQISITELVNNNYTKSLRLRHAFTGIHEYKCIFNYNITEAILTIVTSLKSKLFLLLTMKQNRGKAPELVCCDTFPTRLNESTFI